MIKIFLFISIFVFISLKSIPSVKLGVNTTIDINNNEFKFEYNGPGHDIILFYFQFDQKYIHSSIECPDHSISGGNEYSRALIHIGKRGTCTIKFDPEEKDKGSFVIYTLNNKLSIKLKNKYGNLSSRATDDDSNVRVSKLTFSVPKIDRDATVNFEYDKSVNIRRESFSIENPFKVCHNKDCKESLSTYEFKKGESYEITIKLFNANDEYGDKYILIPGFTFYDQKYNGTYSPDDILDIDTNSANGLKLKLLFISLIILLL